MRSVPDSWWQHAVPSQEQLSFGAFDSQHCWLDNRKVVWLARSTGVTFLIAHFFILAWSGEPVTAEKWTG